MERSRRAGSASSRRTKGGLLQARPGARAEGSERGLGRAVRSAVRRSSGAGRERRPCERWPPFCGGVWKTRRVRRPLLVLLSLPGPVRRLRGSERGGRRLSARAIGVARPPAAPCGALCACVPSELGAGLSRHWPEACGNGGLQGRAERQMLREHVYLRLFSSRSSKPCWAGIRSGCRVV